MLKKLLLFAVSALILSAPLTVSATQISVPSAPGTGYLLVSTTTGAYVATSTNQVTVGSLNATNTNATSSLQHTSITGAVSILGEYFTNFTNYVRSLLSPGTGIGYSGGVITNTGVTSIVAGTNVTISGSTGAVTINSTATGGGGSGNVATSSLETAGFLPYWTSTNGTPATLGKVATSSIGAGTGLTFSGTAGAQVGGTSGTYSLATIASGNFLANGTSATAIPTAISTSTIFGTGTGGKILAWNNGVPQWIASTTYSNGTGISTSFANGALTITNTGVTSVGLSSPNSTLSITSTPVTTTGTLGADLNLAHGNTWTALQNFSNATSTLFSSAYASSTQGYFGTLNVPSLGTPAGTFLAVDPTGKVIATTTPINTGGSSEGVQWATVAVLAGTPTYSNGTLGVGATLTEIGSGALSVDGNSPAANDRVLVKNQASAFQNGIYVVTATGSGIASYILTRSTDYNSNTEITPGLTTYVVSGTANLDTNWAVSFTVPLTMGTTNLNYTEVSGGGASVTSVSNSDSSITFSPTSGAVIGSLNIGHTNLWTSLQQFNGHASTTGISTIGSEQVGDGVATTTIKGDATSTFQGAITISNSQATSTFDKGVQATNINLTSSTATSTAANGFNLTGGCYAISGTCVGGSSGSTPAFTFTMAAGATMSANTPVYEALSASSIAYDNSAEIENVATGFNLSLTVGTAGNAVVLGTVTCPSAVATGITATFGGSSMTLLKDSTIPSTSGHQYVYIITNPTTGGANFSASYTGGTTCQAAAASYTGVVQSTTPDAMVTATGSSGTTFSGSVTTVANGAWVVSLMGGASGSAVTGGTNFTRRTGFEHNVIGDTNGQITPAGSVSVSATGSSQNWSLVMVSLAPITGPQFTLFNTSSAASGTANGFLGFLTAGVSSGATATVQVGGILSGFSGLSQDSFYYLNDTTGTIGTSAGTVTRKVGIAVTTTSLLITNNW